MAWSTESLSGPDGEDWRVPTSELEMRQSRFIEALEGGSAWVSDPVDMYWLVGNRQAGGVHFSSDGMVTQYVRNSLERARFEAGGNDAPHDIVSHPRMAALSESVCDHRHCNWGEYLLQMRLFFNPNSEMVAIALRCFGRLGKSSQIGKLSG